VTAANQRLGYGDYLRFRDLILERSGLYFHEKKQRDLEIGLFKALKDAPTDIADLNSYYRFLKEAASPAAKAELDRLINLLTIGETYFFRDSAQFDALINQVLPQLIALKRARAIAAAGSKAPPIPQLRLWSAGCASGEEPYSLAIALRELLPDIDNWRIYILATDINHDALVRARQAEYSDWSFREERARALRSRYFMGQAKRLRLKPEICRMVTFAHHNLAEDNFPSVVTNTLAMDLILCRNVTIYFPEAVTRRVVDRFYLTLADGGWLAVGHSEPSLTTYRAFQSRNFPGAVLYQKTGEPSPWPDQWELFDAPSNGLKNSSAVKFASFEDNLGSGHDSQHKLTTFAGFPIKKAADPPPPDMSHPPVPTTPLDQAQTLLKEGQITAAISLLEEKLPKEKTVKIPADWHAPGCCLLARLYADRGQLTKARRWGNRAIELDTLLAEAYYIVALVEEQEGRFVEAIDLLKKVIYLDRTGPLPYFNLAMLYKKREQPDRAQQSLNNLSRILASWLPEQIIPDTDGTTAADLLRAAHQLMAELK
jgi:chemotaxis protein methyltransferase CheR